MQCTNNWRILSLALYVSVRQYMVKLRKTTAGHYK